MVHWWVLVHCGFDGELNALSHTAQKCHNNTKSIATRHCKGTKEKKKKVPVTTYRHVSFWLSGSR
jgi:hypothetical protein